MLQFYKDNKDKLIKNKNNFELKFQIFDQRSMLKYCYSKKIFKNQSCYCNKCFSFSKNSSMRVSFNQNTSGTFIKSNSKLSNADF